MEKEFKYVVEEISAEEDIAEIEAKLYEILNYYEVKCYIVTAKIANLLFLLTYRSR